MDAQALETEALAAVAAASSTEDVERIRIEYLGRKIGPADKPLIVDEP